VIVQVCGHPFAAILRCLADDVVGQISGLALASSGPVDVPGALVPVHVSVEHDHAVYVAPNVWMHRRCQAFGPRPHP